MVCFQLLRGLYSEKESSSIFMAVCTEQTKLHRATSRPKASCTKAKPRWSTCTVHIKQYWFWAQWLGSHNTVSARGYLQCRCLQIVDDVDALPAAASFLNPDLTSPRFISQHLGRHVQQGSGLAVPWKCQWQVAIGRNYIVNNPNWSKFCNIEIIIISNTKPRKCHERMSSQYACIWL